MIERKLTKNKGSVILTLNQELMTLLGYQDKVYIEIDDNNNLILRKDKNNEPR